MGFGWLFCFFHFIHSILLRFFPSSNIWLAHYLSQWFIFIHCLKALNVHHNVLQIVETIKEKSFLSTEKIDSNSLLLANTWKFSLTFVIPCGTDIFFLHTSLITEHSCSRFILSLELSSIMVETNFYYIVDRNHLFFLAFFYRTNSWHPIETDNAYMECT